MTIFSRIWRFVSTVTGVIFRHPVTGAILIPVLSSGEIVLVRRRDTGYWGLPGGMVDWGEDIPTTIRRELREETGLELVRMIRLVGVYSSRDRDPRLHSIGVTVAVEAQGILRTQDQDEILEVRAFPPDYLPQPLSHDHQRQLQDYLQELTVVA
jgi:ADP-ribose pyrophosphatase YjhB (NUDIX family)